MLRVLDAATGRPLAAHRVNGGVDYDWLGDTLVVTQLDFTSPWRIRSDLYRWVPGRAWRRMTHGARLVAPGAGGGRLAAIVLGAASGRPTVPAPALPRGAVWEDVAPSPDGRWVAGSRSADGHWALVRWPVDSPDAASVLVETGGSIADVGPTGRFGGPLTAGTDALGRFAYAADLLVAPQPFRASGDFALISSVLGNPTLDFSAWTSWADLGSPSSAPNVTVSELDRYAALGASFVTRRWRSLTSVRLAAELERFDYATIPDTALAAVCPGCDAQSLVGGSVTLTLTRLVNGALSISPEDGIAWSATYRRREEPGTSRWSNELRSRLALYAHVPGLGGFAHHVLALRLMVGGTSGPLGTLFRVGGVAPQGVNVFFAPTLSATRAFPLRGYASGELRGERAAAGSVERSEERR